MDCVKGMLCFSKTRQMEEEWFSSFLENGSKLLEGLLASSDGKYGVPYRNFTAKELIRATNNFTNRVMDDGTGSFFRGCFQERQILVKIDHDRGVINSDYFHRWHSYTVNDIVISLQMSHHKNVFKLLGCCLEFRTPALVYEYNAGNIRLLSDRLHYRREGVFSKDVDSSLSLRVKLKLAVDIANALVYLHSAFATPIIHRDLCTRNIVIFPDGVAKLLDFSLCISLPPGESHVEEDCVVGVTGYIEPEYCKSGIITEKTDVYRFGMLLLELLTGEKPLVVDRKFVHLVDHVKEHFVSNQVDRILDPIILVEKAASKQVQEQQIQAFAELALRCTRPTGRDRPDMISVAKELTQIMKSFHFT